MKNFITAFVFLLSFSILNSVNAQSSSQSFEIADQSTKEVNDNSGVTVLTAFKATKSQRKVISKVRSYVTPKVFTKKVNTATLEGKTVKLQMSLDEKGSINYIVVVNGILPKIDERVIQLVRAYNEENPFADAKLDKPAVLQMDIPVVSKKYYGR